ncbi:leucine-rich repeat receptor protein kinase EMS1-like [Amaranthus tricolor]|uniref:leucine-rich repeat receptor protein kinase EMS1-like n=1 Tax=Amaranthus tricolor TaxID=29722 RepID=UPI00258D40A3|nr:leucine-rich repeat receptor protein kinase EMS1-like [Amaranthus tricolor]
MEFCNLDERSVVSNTDVSTVTTSESRAGELGKLHQLRVLTLGSNEFSGKIPSELGNLSLLINLDMSDNHLKGDIPKSIGKLNSLQNLDLSANNFSVYGELEHVRLKGVFCRYPPCLSVLVITRVSHGVAFLPPFHHCLSKSSHRFHFCNCQLSFPVSSHRIGYLAFSIPLLSFLYFLHSSFIYRSALLNPCYYSASFFYFQLFLAVMKVSDRD